MTPARCPTKGWSPTIRLLHWLTAVAVLAELVVSFGPMATPAGSFASLPMHMTIGSVVAVLLLLRIGRRLIERAPGAGLSPLVRAAASFAHLALYLLLGGVLLTGWAGYTPSPFLPRSRLFNVVPMPPYPFASPLEAGSYAELHRTLIWALLALLAVHIAAALIHAIRRDGVAGGMLGSPRGSASKQDG